ncbi:MAG: DUF2974 domain-containing protein [Bacteroidetes bacterium]|nr:DUF2974 domain-containing protein [Bacteroidota bacterium]
MKKAVMILVALCFWEAKTHAQNYNPYSVFGYQGKVLKTPEEESGKQYLKLMNQDTALNFTVVIIDSKKGQIVYLSKNDSIVNTSELPNNISLRFLSVDPLSKDYPMLTPYQFASNTPIQAIDLDGLEAFYVHGTWSDPNTFPKTSVTTASQIMGNSTSNTSFQWTGNNADPARQKAATQLAEHIRKNRDPNQPLTLVGHSHGGNIAIMAANILNQDKNSTNHVTSLLTVNTPVREYQLDNNSPTKHFNVYSNDDNVQSNGGNSVNIPDGAIVMPMPTGGPLVIPTFGGSIKYISGEFGNAGRTFQNATNIQYSDQVNFLKNPVDATTGHGGFLPENVRQWSPTLNNAVNGTNPNEQK